MSKYAAACHKVLGVAIICIYPFYLYNMESIQPKMAEALKWQGYMGGRAKAGLQLYLLLPMVSACFFLFPEWFTRKFSPRTDLLKEPLLTPGFWYFIGDLLMVFFFIGCLGFI